MSTRIVYILLKKKISYSYERRCFYSNNQQKHKKKKKNARRGSLILLYYSLHLSILGCCGKGAWHHRAAAGGRVALGRAGVPRGIQRQRKCSRCETTSYVTNTTQGFYYGGAYDISSNQDPRWTQKAIYTPVFTHHIRS